MTSSQDAFNYAIGALACMSALVSVILYYQSYLPITQMKALDELLHDTKNLYTQAQADGILPHETAFTDKLEELELESDELREQAYKATTQLEEYRALMRGLSRKIMRTAASVRRFRAYIINASEDQRRRQREARRASIADRRTGTTGLLDAQQIPRTDSATADEDTTEAADFSDGQITRPPIHQCQDPAGCAATPEPSSNKSMTPDNTTPLDPALALDSGSLSSNTSESTMVDNLPSWWTTVPIPFTKRRWCLELPEIRDLASERQSPSVDIRSLPV